MLGPHKCDNYSRNLALGPLLRFWRTECYWEKEGATELEELEAVDLLIARTETAKLNR